MGQFNPVWLVDQKKMIHATPQRRYVTFCFFLII